MQCHKADNVANDATCKQRAALEYRESFAWMRIRRGNGIDAMNIAPVLANAKLPQNK